VSIRGFAFEIPLPSDPGLARRGDDGFYDGASKIRPARMSWRSLPPVGLGWMTRGVGTLAGMISMSF
jgi:hypothetical protein